MWWTENFDALFSPLIWCTSCIIHLKNYWHFGEHFSKRWNDKKYINVFLIITHIHKYFELPFDSISTISLVWLKSFHFALKTIKAVQVLLEFIWQFNLQLGLLKTFNWISGEDINLLTCACLGLYIGFCHLKHKIIIRIKYTLNIFI